MRWRRWWWLSLGLLASSAVHAAGALVDLRVVDRTAGVLPEYAWRGRTYVVGQPGQAFELALTNRSSDRVLVVVSVDGVNVVTGETAATTQNGYVLGPYQSYAIRGWRKSLQDVAQFYFTPLSDSYAGRTGRPDNVGVIGMAVFHEQAPDVAAVPPLAPSRPRANPARAAEAKETATAEAQADTAGTAAASRLGTGHGAREHAPVATTTFVRAAGSPAQVTSVYYDREERLRAQGVLPRPRPPQPGPQPFPGGFVPDPPYR